MADPLRALGCEPFTPAGAVARGVSTDALRSLWEAGVVRRVLRGAYVVATVSDSLPLRAAAAALVAPPDAVVCGRTAAWLVGVDALAMGAHKVLPDVDLKLPAGRNAARRAGVFGSSGPLTTDDVVDVGPLLVTSPTRTAADLARLLPRQDALPALDAMLRLRLVNVVEVRHALESFAGYRGVVQARQLLELASPLPESPQESRTRLRCVDAGFPVPEPQVVVHDINGVFVARLDLGWRLTYRALEYDGDEHHSHPDDMRRDRIRRQDVERQGWGVAVVTAREVLGRHLEFEGIVSDLLGLPYQLTAQHPCRGGWGRDLRGLKRPEE